MFDSRNGVFVRADQPLVRRSARQLYDVFAFDGDLPLYLELAVAGATRYWKWRAAAAACWCRWCAAGL